MSQDHDDKKAMSTHVGDEITRSIAEAKSKNEPVDLEDVRQLEIDDLLAMAGYSIDLVPATSPIAATKPDDSTSPWSPNFSQTLNCGGQEFTLVPATIDDTPVFVDLFYSIFKDDLIFRAMYGTASWDLVTARTISQWRSEFCVPFPSRLRWFKVLSPSNRIIAIAKWGFPHPKTAEDSEISPPMDEDERIEGENKEIGDTWFRGLTENRERWLDAGRMYYINTLAVLPEYQGMGVGMAVVRSVLDVADREGRGCYVEASSQGMRLYRKCGFKEVGRLEVDCGKVVDDEDAVFITVSMVRDPAAQK